MQNGEGIEKKIDKKTRTEGKGRNELKKMTRKWKKSKPTAPLICCATFSYALIQT